MDRTGLLSVEIVMERIKQKISNDDILSNILNGENLTIREDCEDWEIECGRNIVDLYKKLSKMVEKIR